MNLNAEVGLDLQGLPPLLVPEVRELVLLGRSAEVSVALVQDVEQLARVLRGLTEASNRGIGRVGNGLITAELRAAGGEMVAGGYELRVFARSDGLAAMEIGGDLAGLRGAIATVRQLLRQYHRRVPCLSVRDWPTFAIRGVLVDISRDRVPNAQHFECICDDLASFKFNHLQLYTEHAFAYEDHPQVWGGESPMTGEEIRQLDRMCAERGIELAANQNCFGHLREWLKHPEYADLAEIEPGEKWKFMEWERRGPFSLNPTDPKALEFVEGLLRELLANFTSERVNIGCDETFDVGWGRSREVVAARGAELMRIEGLSEEAARSRARAELFFGFVGKVCEVVRGLGKRPLMWADIALKHPEMLGLLGRDVTGLVWGYEAETEFARGLRALEGAGLARGWVCPGTSSWRSITGRTTEARANLGRAAEEGRACGAAGYLVCDWGDVGHMQHWPIALRRIVDGAQAAWTGRARGADVRAVSLHAFRDDSLRIAGWLDELGEVDGELRRGAHANYSKDPSSHGIKNATAMFNDLFPPVPIEQGDGTGESAGHAVQATVGEWEGVRARLSRLPLDVLDYGNRLEQRELVHTLAFARFAVEHAIAQRLDGAGRAARLRELVRPARDLLEEHRALWEERSRPGGLRVSCSHLERGIAGLESVGGGGRD